jgi:hypothetical protein
MIDVEYLHAMFPSLVLVYQQGAAGIYSPCDDNIMRITVWSLHYEILCVYIIQQKKDFYFLDTIIFLFFFVYSEDNFMYCSFRRVVTS